MGCVYNYNTSKIGVMTLSGQTMGTRANALMICVFTIKMKIRLITPNTGWKVWRNLLQLLPRRHGCHGNGERPTNARYGAKEALELRHA